MRGLYLAVLCICATGFLTERNLLKYLYVLHSGLYACISPPPNLCHPHPQRLSPPLSKEKEDALLTSAVLFCFLTPPTWLDAYKHADPGLCMDMRYLIHEEPMDLCTSHTPKKVASLEQQAHPSQLGLSGLLPIPAPVNLEGHFLVDTRRRGTQAGVSHRCEHSSSPMLWAGAAILSLLNHRDFCCCQR